MKQARLWMILLVLLLAGCSGGHTMEITDHHWILDSIQSVAEDGAVIAWGTGRGDAPDSETRLQWSYRAEGGVLTLTDQTNDKTYTGTYTRTDADPDSTTYEVMLDGREGMAVVSRTTDEEGGQVPTCIFRFNEYVVTCFAEESPPA